MSRARGHGFTLIEVLVSVVLAAAVALLAHQLFGAALEASRQAREARLALDRQANAHRFLNAAFLSLEVGVDSATLFQGMQDRVRFSAWLLTADGWPERRTVDLGQLGDRWVVTAPPDAEIELARHVAVHFDYLLGPGAQSTWVGQWESAVSAPLAVRARVRHEAGTVDTMLFLIKARG
jgi:prepilin-type N-terminal cleavage/methylation domain-containing protein